jgi:ubiquinone biosynthesis protein UbiJ
MIIKPLISTVLETALNHYLSLDGNASQFLAPLAGKVIAVTITPFSETLYLCPTAGGIQLIDDYPKPPDTRLTGSLLALGLMGLSAKPMRAIFSGQVKIEGDMHIGRKFQDLFAKLDINVEKRLARYTGDTIAHNFGQFFRAGQVWGQETLANFQLNTAEFLQEESRDLPATAELEVFYQQIDDLRLNFDRLHSRLVRLENKAATPAPTPP